MKRDEILARLGALWLEADDTEEFLAALFDQAAGLAGGPRMKQILGQLQTAHPGDYRDAVSGTTLHKRRYRYALDLSKYLADADDGVSQFEWAINHHIEPKALQRWLKRYRDDPEFRVDTDEMTELWRKAKKKTLL